ncbi:MAG: DUF72 domain-containing protein [Acidimicrobiia bacterium]
MSDQIPLFDLEPAAPDDPSAEAVARVHEAARAIAADMPDEIRFGTSSWSFPGWKGIVYSGAVTSSALSRDGLRQYAQHPLLRTVGIDRSYYAPIPIEDLRRYADQLPAGFKGCAKAPASVTSTIIGPPGSTTPNPDFMSVPGLIEELLLPFSIAFPDHTGPFILEFPPFPKYAKMPPAEFLSRLDRFLSELPPDFQYAVELRDQRLLTPEYFAMLVRHGIGHTYNYWSAMPELMLQARVIPPETLPFAVIRLLLKPGSWYEDQKERFHPFNAGVAPDEAIRRDVVGLSDRVLTSGRKLWVLVNNKAEGSSPLSIMELARRVAERRKQLLGAERHARMDSGGAVRIGVS